MTLDDDQGRAASAHSAIRLVVSLVYCAAVAFIQIDAGQPGDLWWWPLAIAFFLWTVAPIVVPLTRWRPGWPVTLIVTLIAGASLWVYQQAMYGEGLDPQSALIFIFLPLYQWGAVLLAKLIAETIGRWWPQ